MNIRDLPIETLLIQLAEESSELSQAALKYVRVLRSETPVSEQDARTHLIEEIADVSVCMTALNRTAPAAEICEVIAQKVQRWEDRLNGEG